VNPGIEGKAYPPVSFRVDPDRVRAFRACVGVAEGVPPTFATAAEFTVFPTVIADPELDLDLRRVVHGSQEYVYARPLEEGETLTVRTRIESIRMRAGSGFLTLVTQLEATDGAVVCTARALLIERGEP
jgi:acyl dehydratase